MQNSVLYKGSGIQGSFNKKISFHRTVQRLFMQADKKAKPDVIVCLL